MTEKDILGKKLLFVTAHPDDESFLAAGTIYKNNLFGGTSCILCATYGEKGKTYIPGATASQLKQIRKKELLQVCLCLNVQKMYGLSLPDGELVNNGEKLRKSILSAIKSFKPDIIFSFGRDGITGHMDHVVIGEICKKIVGELKIPFSTFAAPPLYIKHFDAIKERRNFGVYHKSTTHPAYNFRVRIDPEIKHQALGCHKSQADKGNPFHNIPKSVQKQWLGYEYFCAA
jgi:LmbE family N-acetylglucosaminyl deacetylase